MKRLRSFACLFMVASTLLVGPETAVKTFSSWETHAANCFTNGGTVEDTGRCAGSLNFYDCYDPAFADACYDYCLGGPSGFGDSPNHWCNCNPCGG